MFLKQKIYLIVIISICILYIIKCIKYKIKSIQIKKRHNNVTFFNIFIFFMEC